MSTASRVKTVAVKFAVRAVRAGFAAVLLVVMSSSSFDFVGLVAFVGEIGRPVPSYLFIRTHPDRSDRR